MMLARAPRSLFAKLAQISLILSIAFSAMLAGSAIAMVEPVPVFSDPRIKVITYGPDQVYKYTGYLKYQTSMELAPGETVQTITLGDPTGWRINPSGNKVFLKPLDVDVTTNMMMITNKRTYLFELRADEVKDISDPRLTWILRFVYPDEGDASVISIGAAGDGVPDLDSEDLSKYNFRYTITGSEEISPIRIFDDGEFTFFEFRGINADIPAIFMVNKEGDEALINFRTRGHFIVVERVSGRYTLRLGKQVVCVFNEAWGKPAKGTSSKNSTSSSSHSTTIK